MKLYKFCPREFNPKFGCKTIQIGTLSYYREMEKDKKISDENEAVESIGIHKYDPKKASPELRQRMAFWGNSTVSGLTFKMLLPNCYIFCLSTSSDDSLSGTNFCDNYDSIYQISNIDDFSNTMARSILSILKVWNFEKNDFVRIVNNKEILDDVSLTVIHRCINYKRLGNIIVDSKLVHDEPQPSTDELIFTKDPRFSSDNEYRIAFIFTRDGKILPVKKEPLIIPIEPMLEFIS